MSQTGDREAEAKVPGILLVYHGEHPIYRALRIPAEGLVIGRELLGDSKDDDRLSRQHTRVTVERGVFTVADLMSRNGTYLEGALMDREAKAAAGAVVRSGRTVGVLQADIRRFEGAQAEATGAPAAKLISDAEFHALLAETQPLELRPDWSACLVHAMVKRTAPMLAVHASLIEMCLRKRWKSPQHLYDEVRRIAAMAVATGQKEVREQKEAWQQQRSTEQLRTRPPKPLSAPPSVPPDPEDKYARVLSSSQMRRGLDAAISRDALTMQEQIAAALREQDGDLGRAARALGLTEVRLRHFLSRFPELMKDVRSNEPDLDDDVN